MAKTPTPTPTTGPAPDDHTAAPEEETPQGVSVFRRHPLATAITGGAIAVVLVSGLTAWGVGAAVTASLTSSNTEMPSTGTMAMPAASPTGAPTTGGMKAGGTKADGRLAFRATIKSIGTDSWTILTKKGKTVTVAVTSSTQFGTKRMSATASSFAVGDNVVVVATRGTDGQPTAIRIAAPMT